MRLVVEDLRHAYSRQGEPVLRGVDLEVPSGRSCAVTGPSGSGKTTLLALIGGLLHRQQGRIVVWEHDGTERAAPDVVSWVLQTVSLLPERSAADNVALGAFSAGATRATATHRAAQYLAAVGLRERASEPARVLSGGEAQRVAVARALASERPIILADEPTGQLDASTSALVVEALVAHGRTLVVATHDPEVAARCDTVVELRDGVIGTRRGEEPTPRGAS